MQWTLDHVNKTLHGQSSKTHTPLNNFTQALFDISWKETILSIVSQLEELDGWTQTESKISRCHEFWFVESNMHVVKI